MAAGIAEAAAAEVAELGRVVATLDLERVPTQYFGVTKMTSVKANDATRTHVRRRASWTRFCGTRWTGPDGRRCVRSTSPGRIMQVSHGRPGCPDIDGALDGDEPFVGGELELGIGVQLR